MVKFKKIRLNGFKSFVDPTELNIEHGITGIVGPNGCGKSNLVEALRWAMGETSAKRIRGSEMEDVIFAGSGARPSRNIAEVVLELDNSDRSAPAAFNDQDSLEIARRIERGCGSNYRINGREVRAKDVQLLFADAATGAHSTALVSQGRIGAIINAKPTDRRSLLEEAAGITGLHSRRHEAELRLRAAETNLERLDDVIATLESQLQGLKKQARQANRYRNLATHIRRHEAILLYLDGQRAQSDVETAREALTLAEAQVTEIASTVAVATTEQAGAASVLPQLRQDEAAAAAALQRLLVDRDNLDREEAQLVEAKARTEAHLAEIESDRSRAITQAKDALEALERLAAETQNVEQSSEGEAEQREVATQALTEADAAVQREETAAAELSDRIASGEARKATIGRQIDDLSQRLERLKAQLERVVETRSELEQNQSDKNALAESKQQLESVEAHLKTLRQEATAAAERLQAARVTETEARAVMEKAAKARDLSEAEIAALAKLLESDQGDIWPPIVDALTVETGFEIALGAALGDDLEASADEASPIHWEALAPYGAPQALPAGAEPLSSAVTGPNALKRRLSQIGVVADKETGRRLQKDLAPGQRIVTRDGDLWRWDGFAAKAEAPTAAATRMSQRNRLAELRRALPDLQTRHEADRKAHQEAAEKVQDATAQDGDARRAVDAIYGEVSIARDRQAEMAQRVAATASRLATLQENHERLSGEIGECDATLTQVKTEQVTLPDTSLGRGELIECRTRLAEHRSQMAQAQNALDRLVSEAKARTERLSSIGGEIQSWQRRTSEAERHLELLATRKAEAQSQLEALADRPAEIAERREVLVEQVEGAEVRRKTAADYLAEGETRLAKADRDLKAKEQTQAEARENRVRAEAAVEQSVLAQQTVVARVRERLECAPDQVMELAELDPSQELPAYEQVDDKLNRLLRERDGMGPVNLLAEQEATELDEQIKGLQVERSDLVEAIARLRQGISSLNREGRQRLLAAFEEVNTHFSDLFVRLFGGGKAYLKLTEADDPLDAGLEVMASPPGKKLQVLSLLSGGEQALTALALLFAVFLTNPAPICVLDEVDAPLDDANVDRFCRLVEELSERSSTRFLIITHHRMTMARMNRLFGVTMAERGVSQLVSVDLESAEEIRETA